MAQLANNFKSGVLLGEFDLEADNLVAILMKSGFTFDPDDVFIDDVVASEADATNYARQTLTTPAVVKDDTDDLGKFHCDDIPFGVLGGAVNNAIAGLLIAKVITNDADSPIIGYIPTTPFTTDGTPVTFDEDAAEGLLQLAG